MSRDVTPEGRDALEQTEPSMRYASFIKLVVDREEAFGLWDGDWWMQDDGSGRRALPLWSSREDAAAYALGVAAECSPREIPLDALVDDLLLRLAAAGVRAQVAPVPESAPHSTDLAELEADLRAEMELY